jgi:hypothetical protein
MRLDPHEAPPATPCDPHRTRDVNPSWSCEVPGCECGSTPAIEFKPPVSVEVVVEGGAFERVEADLVRLSTHAKRRAEASERHPDWPRGSQAANIATLLKLGDMSKEECNARLATVRRSMRSDRLLVLELHECCPPSVTPRGDVEVEGGDEPASDL